jgi:hypothetical protein
LKLLENSFIFGSDSAVIFYSYTSSNKKSSTEG